MPENFIYTSCPVIPEMLYVAKWVDNPATEKKELVRFQKEVHWIYESESQTQILWRGKLFSEHGCYRDFYGYGTSVRGAISEAQKLCHDLTPEGHLVVQVRVKVSRIPALPTILDKFDMLPRKKLKRLEKDFFVGTDEIFDRIASFDWDSELESEWRPYHAILSEQNLGELIIWRSDESRPIDPKAIFIERFPEPRERLG